MGNDVSDLLNASSGVSQGNILGLLLFLSFINDVTKVIPEPVSLKLFTDGCSLKNI